jgi:hypothetical protein
MSEQATGPGVDEDRHLQRSLKTRRTTMDSPGDVYRGRAVHRWMAVLLPPAMRDRNSVPKQSASFSPVSSNLLGEG